MHKLAVSASSAEPVRTSSVAACSVAHFPSGFDALDSRYEDGDGTSPWNTRAG
jgi:hypothetical protein